MGAGGTGKMEWGWARALALEEEHTVFPLDPKYAVGKRGSGLLAWRPPL